MEHTRRVILRVLAGIPLGLLGWTRWGAGPARAAVGRWSVRRATKEDTASLARVFNAHLAAGICPYADRTPPWTAERAGQFLDLYTGALVVELDSTPVGFAGLIDYMSPETTSAIAPEGEPPISVLAFDLDHLSSSEVVLAAKTLAAAIGQELQRMGFRFCRLRLPAEPALADSDWYRGHMTVRRVRKRRGLPHALEVSIDVPGALARLAAEGL